MSLIGWDHKQNDPWFTYARDIFKCIFLKEKIWILIILFMLPANERRYIVTSSLIGWEHKQNDPWSTYACDIFKCIFLKEKIWILIQILQKFACKGLIDNKAVLIHVMAWREPGDKPLPGPMLAKMCDAIWCHQASIN